MSGLPLSLLERAGCAVGAVEVLPDEQPPRIESALIHAADEGEARTHHVTTGGTGMYAM